MNFRKLIKKGLLLSAFLIALSSVPAAMPVFAASPADETVMPAAYDIRYLYKIEDGKIYRRLFNYSTGEWIGEWEYFCDYQG
jgi:hypothetical protein